MEKEKSEQKGSKKWLWTVLMILSIVVFLVCAVILGTYYYKQYAAEKTYNELKNNFVTGDTGNSSNQNDNSGQGGVLDPDQNQDPNENKNPQGNNKWKDLLVVDFEALWEVNEDVYAWVDIPGTAVSYPVLQHKEDDGYYLNHTIEHKSGLPGSIYSESCSATDFSDYVHILYGHNMKNGTMFREVREYEKQEFLDAHPYVYVYTPDTVYIYEIFASVIKNNIHIMYTYNFNTEEGRQVYLDNMYTSADFRDLYVDSAKPTAQDKFLILSTCVGQDPEHRHLVNAKLIDEVKR